jgi:hypothetical protein
VPSAIREKITDAIKGYAAVHDRPIDDALLAAMAADIVEVSAFVPPHRVAVYTEFLTENISDTLRNVMRHGHCGSDSVLIMPATANVAVNASAEEWDGFAALCERATIRDAIDRMIPQGVA